MKETTKVAGVVIFGVLMSLGMPFLTNINIEKQMAEKEAETEMIKSTSNEVAIVTKEDESGTPIEQPKEEVVKPEPEPTPEPVQKEEPVAVPIVFDGMTLDELAAKLDRSLKSTLAGTGMSFAKHATELGIDPYLAVAIVLHETGCNGTCSEQVRNCYNVGGMKGGPSCNGTSYKKFNSLDEGIAAFMNNLKVKYYDQGLNTPELMNKKYAASQTWASKVNMYIEKLKAA